MAVAWGTETLSIVAVSNSTVLQFAFQDVNSNGAAARPAAGGFAVGVAQNALSTAEAAAGTPVQIKFQGGTKVLTATSFAAGAKLKVDSDGKVLALSTAVTEHTVAIALEAATAANQIVSALIIGPDSKG